MKTIRYIFFYLILGAFLPGAIIAENLKATTATPAASIVPMASQANKSVDESTDALAPASKEDFYILEIHKALVPLKIRPLEVNNVA